MGRPLVELPPEVRVPQALEEIIKSLQDLIIVDSREHLLYTETAIRS